MATLKDYRDERLRKLDELKQLGVNPYPAKANRSNTCQEITEKFEELEGQQTTIVGRVKGIRKFGKIAFVVVADAHGQVQLFFRDGGIQNPNFANSELAMDHLPLLDTGDFIEATGTVIKTQTGEISVEVQTLRLHKIASPYAKRRGRFYEQRRTISPPICRHKRKQRCVRSLHPAEYILASNATVFSRPRVL